MVHSSLLTGSGQACHTARGGTACCLTSIPDPSQLGYAQDKGLAHQNEELQQELAKLRRQLAAALDRRPSPVQWVRTLSVAECTCSRATYRAKCTCCTNEAAAGICQLTSVHDVQETQAADWSPANGWENYSPRKNLVRSGSLPCMRHWVTALLCEGSGAPFVP